MILPDTDQRHCRYCLGTGWQAVVIPDERGTDMQYVRLCYCPAAPASITLGSRHQPEEMHRPATPLSEPDWKRRAGTDVWERSKDG